MVEVIVKIFGNLRLNLVVAMAVMCFVEVTASTNLREDPQYKELMERVDDVNSQIELLQEELDQHRDDYAKGKGDAVKLIEAAELKMFDLQQQHNALDREVEEMVQSWELSRIGEDQGDGVARHSRVELEEGDESVVTLSRSKMMSSLLSLDDLKRLQQADARESRLWDIFTLSIGGHSRLVEMAQRYAQCKKESEALEIQGSFGRVAPVVDSLFRVLGSEWGEIYDHKVYCYAVLLESHRRSAVLEAGEQILRDGVLGVESDDENPYRLAQLYDMQKRAMLRYESSVAQDLGFVVALDSLRGALKSVTARGEVEPLERVEIVERNFIDYSDITFSTSSVYKKSSQIPEAKLYQRGRIYRLQLGAYKTAQLPTIFRGAHPITYDKSFGFWTYYTGAFATYVEAEKAQKLCRSKGFNRPEIVVWDDGVRRNYGREPLPATKGFRVVVEGVDELSSDVEALIKSMSGDVEVSKLGATKYIISTIDIRPKADEVAEALMALNDAIECEVIEVE